MNTEYLIQQLEAIQSRLQALEQQGEPEFDSGDVAGGLVQLSNKLEEMIQLSAETLDQWELERERVRRKSQFIQALFHEARESWLLILSSTNLLEHHFDEFDETHRAQHFQRIRAASRNFTRLMEELLILNEGQNFLPGFQPTDLDLLEFCRLLLENPRLNPVPERIQLTQGGQPRTAYLDATLLRGMLINLLDNALNFSTEKINLELIWQQDTVVIQVRDRGIGIPEAEQTELFQPFYRASNAEGKLGSGIGLSVVKRAVDLHNGTIAIDSEVNQGTTVTVILPIEAKAAAHPALLRNVFMPDLA